jgi:hypothetical protein
MTVLTLVAAAAPQRPPSRPSRLLDAGLLAGPVFTLAYVAEGLCHGHGYSWLRDPVSSLALGSQGWAQVANFVVGGVLMLLFAVGLRRSLHPGPGAAALPFFVTVWGVGLLGAGLFRTDPLGGPVTWHGQLHDLAFSLPGFTALALAMLTAAVTFTRRGSGRFAIWSGLSAVTFVVFFVLATAGFAGAGPLTATAGLWQRLCVSAGWLWLALLASARRRQTPGVGNR